MVRSQWKASAAFVFAALVISVAIGILVTRGGTDPKVPTVDLGEVEQDAMTRQLAEAGGEHREKPQLSPAAALEAKKRRKYVPRQTIVRFERSSTAAERAAARRRVGAKVIRSLAVDRTQLVSLPKGTSVKKASRTLASMPGVEYSEPNFIAHATETIPNDPLFASNQWSLRNTGQTGGVPGADIGATSAWDTSTGGSDVTVAIVDSGVDYLHPDLAANIWTNDGEMGPDGLGGDKSTNLVDDDGNGFVDDFRGWDFEDHEKNPMDEHLHGTHVAGTVAAVGNNGEGIAGVSWAAKLMALRGLDENGQGSLANLTDALEYAAENGADVVNGSYGWYGSEPSATESAVFAENPGTLFVFAAGNDSWNNDSDLLQAYPCSNPAENVVCVAATDENDAIASFSNFGKSAVDIAAPGVGIASAKASVYDEISGNYVSMSGTSMAAPHVAGAAAVLKSATPDADASELKSALLVGARPLQALAGKVHTGARLEIVGSFSHLATIANPAQATTYVSGDGELVFRTVSGIDDEIDVTTAGGKIRLSNASTAIAPGDNCVSVSATAVDCNAAEIDRLRITTRDGADSVDSSINLPTAVNLGEGDDQSTTGGGDDVIDGGPGADDISGGDGVDTVDYSDRTANLEVSVEAESVADDGEENEFDNVAGDVENIDAGSGDDLLVGNDSGNRIDGGQGDDTVFADSGDDVVVALADDGVDVTHGGDGVDTVDYSESRTLDAPGAELSLDDEPNDGVDGETDNISDDVENVIGTSSIDLIIGNDQPNRLVGGMSDDDIRGGDGDDELYGESGHDVVDGGAGADTLVGGDGFDEADYSARTEDVHASIDGSSDDGESGESDFIKDDIENVATGSGDDVLVGNDAPNRLKAGSGDDSLSGQGESDELDPGLGEDTVEGGAGDADFVTYAERSENLNLSLDGERNDGASAEMDLVAGNVEGLVGGSGDDVLVGDDRTNQLDAREGNDQLHGNGGDDLLDGGLGTDEVIGGLGVDTGWYFNRDVSLTLTLDGEANDGTEGENDLLDSSIENLLGGQAADLITGDDGPNRLGGVGDDIVRGGPGDDLIEGYGGNGELFGEEGDDRLIAAQNSDAFGWLTISDVPSAHDYPLPYAGGNAELHGGAGNDDMFGGEEGSAFFGGDGDDTMTGWFESDTFSGGAGVDSVSYHYSALAVTANLGSPALDGTGGEDQDSISDDIEGLTGGAEADVLTGSDGPNVLRGNPGPDVLDGAGGDDILDGGKDPDLVNAGTGDDEVLSRDGETDEVNCGAGSDSVRQDASDDIAEDCEADDPIDVTMVELRRDYFDADTLEIRAASNSDDNDFSVTFENNQYIVSDANASLEVGQGCVPVNASTASCAVRDNRLYWIKVLAGDGNDTVLIDPSVDRRTVLNGGDGDDTLTGGSGYNELIGGEGSDSLLGATGIDVATYSDSIDPVSLSIDGEANDGATGENDSIGFGVERLVGGSGSDSLRGGTADEWLTGGAGDDFMTDAGGGNDVFIGGDGSDTVSYADRSESVQINQTYFLPLDFWSQSNRDQYRSGESGEFDAVVADIEKYVGGSGDDTIGCQFVKSVTVDGGAGADVITECETVDYSSRTEPVNVTLDDTANDGEENEGDHLGAGVQGALGGSGDDAFFVANGEVGTITCGDGTDEITVDVVDRPGDDCEVTNGSGLVARDGDSLAVTAQPGVANTLEVSTVGDQLVIEDSTGELAPGFRCTSLSSHSVSCDSAGTARLMIDTGSRDDAVTNATAVPMDLASGSGADSIVGGVSAERIDAGPGDDTVDAGSGSDYVVGGDGEDEIDGAAGVDTLDGGRHADSINGGDDQDTVTYSTRNSPVRVELGGAAVSGEADEFDEIAIDVENAVGGKQDDELIGSATANYLRGGAGHDELDGQAGADSLSGGSGADALDGGADGDVLIGGADFDTADYSARTADLTIDFDGAADDGETGESDNIDLSIEHVIGGSGNDAISGAAATHQLALEGRLGDDQLTGGLERDVLDGGEGADNCVGGNHADILSGGPGNDTLDGAASHDDIFGGAGNDTLVGGAGTDELFGGADDDALAGGNDMDTLDGGLGADLISGDAGVDTVDYGDRENPLTITLGSSPLDGEAGEGDSVTTVEKLIGGSGDDTISATGSTAFTIWGGVGADTITGGTTGDFLYGEAGDDTINGANGNDVLQGGTDDDVLSGGNNDDTMDGGEGADTMSGDAGTSDIATYASRTEPVTVTIGSGANDGEESEADDVTSTTERVLGGSGNDELVGNDSANSLIGGAGSDVLVGGNGNDSLSGGDDGDLLRGEAGIDNSYGGNGDDTLDGGANADVLSGEAGFDTVDYSARTAALNVSIGSGANDGESGENDNISSATERILGGAGNDTLAAVTVTGGVELVGNDGVDDLTGGSYADVLSGGASGDTLNGNGGIDALDGGLGVDTLNGGTGNDTLAGGLNEGSTRYADDFNGGDGVDVADYSARSDSLVLSIDGSANDGASTESDDIGDDIEGIVGGAGNDTMSASASSANQFSGGPGGSDTLTYASRSDGLVLANDGESDSGVSGEGDAISANIEHLVSGSANDMIEWTLDDVPGSVLAGSGADEVVVLGDQSADVQGAAGDDVITARNRPSGAANDLQGGDGDDHITGSKKADEMYGGSGSDTYVGNAGGDYMVDFSAEGNSYVLGSGADFVYSGNGDDMVHSADGYADVVQCSFGTDTLIRDEHDTDVTDCESDSPITVSTVTGDALPGSGDVSFQAGPGLDNDLSVTAADGAYIIQDNGSELVADGECDQTDPITVACTATDFSGMPIQLEGGNDVLAVTAEIELDITANAGAGNDDLTTAAGDDTIDVRDGEIDQVACGQGADSVRADAIDDVEPDCELVSRGPETILDSGPADGAVIGVDQAEYEFSSNEPAATFECAIDEGAFEECESPFETPSLADGSHTFAVRAVDEFGNLDTSPETRAVVVDTAAPVVSITSPADESATSDPAPQLDYSVSDATAHTEECQIDGGDFGECPELLGPFEVGPHSVVVRSTDAAGNVATATSEFTILNPEMRELQVLSGVSGQFNLTTQGRSDWSHWGLSSASSWDHKASGGSLISNASEAGSTGFTRVTTSVMPAVVWSDGDPTASASVSAGLANDTSGVGNGFEFTVDGPSNDKIQTLRLHLGALATQGKLELYWASDTDAIVTSTAISTTSTTSPLNRLVEVRVRPPAETDTLHVRWTQNTNPVPGTSSVRLYSATLSDLSATRESAPETVDLSTDDSSLGTVFDWAHWGGTGSSLPSAPMAPIAKSGVTGISNLGVENSGSVSQANSTALPVTTGFAWSDGDSVTSASGIQTGIANTGGTTGRGLSITVPASTSTSRTLKLYVGASSTYTNSTQPTKLELIWVGDAVPSLTEVVPAFVNSTQNYVYTVHLPATSASASLKARWTTNSSLSGHRAIVHSAVLINNDE